MKKIHTAWTLALLLVAASASQAQAVDPLQARSWAAGCANCHGTNGRAEPGMESLAGVSQEDIVKKMQDYNGSPSRHTHASDLQGLFR